MRNDLGVVQAIMRVNIGALNDYLYYFGGSLL